MTLDDLRDRDPRAAFAIARTLPLEGGWVDDAADPGGATNRGVSLRFALAQIKADPAMIKLFDVDHDGDVDWRDIRLQDEAHAVEVYYECVWLSLGFAKLKPDLVAWKAFDIAVNTGPKRAFMTLQEALCAIGRHVTVDGSFGTQTLAAVIGCSDGAVLLPAMREAQAGFYAGLVASHPEFKRFADGWAKRAAA